MRISLAEASRSATIECHEPSFSGVVPATVPVIPFESLSQNVGTPPCSQPTHHWWSDGETTVARPIAGWVPAQVLAASVFSHSSNEKLVPWAKSKSGLVGTVTTVLVIKTCAP